MKYVMLLMMVCIAETAFAQTAFSLKDCIAYTLSHHNSVKVYDNNTGIAKAQYAQALGLYLPTLNGSATVINNIGLQSTVIPAGVFAPTPTVVQLGTQYNTNLALDISQTIYDQSKMVAINANKSYRQMTELQKQQNQEQLMYNTATAYFQVLVYREQLRLLQINRHKYGEMAKLLEYQYSKGTVLEKDVDRVKVNLNTTSYQIEDAETREILALNTLKNAMGMDMNHPLALLDSVNYESMAAVPLQEAPDLASLTQTKINQISVTLQQYNVKSKQAGYLPTLTATGKWGNQALNNDLSKAWNTWNDYSYIGLSLNVPIFSGLRKKNAVKEEKLKLDNEKLSFHTNQQALQLQYDNAKSSVTTAYSTYKGNRENMELAGKVLAVTDYQYQRGVASLTDYLNDDAAYKAAQTNYISSLYNLMISRLGYHKSQGALTAFLNNIR